MHEKWKYVIKKLYWFSNSKRRQKELKIKVADLNLKN